MWVKESSLFHEGKSQGFLLSIVKWEFLWPRILRQEYEFKIKMHLLIKFRTGVSMAIEACGKPQCDLLQDPSI